MTLLFAAAEIYPYAKTGGLADVAQALPHALNAMIDVTSVMPLYDFIDRDAHGIRPVGQMLRLPLGARRYEATLYGATNRGVRTIFVHEPTLCGRGSPYDAYDDNDLRFAIFSRAVATLAATLRIDVVQLNDWHTAPAAWWLRHESPQIRQVFTIHSLAFQGIFDASRVPLLGLPRSGFTPEGFEFYGRLNLMKAAIMCSDRIVAVSPRYAEEIRTPPFGFGLDGFLRHHGHKVCGILNGLDTELFDPSRDPALAAPYDPDAMEGKAACKAALIQELGLPHPERPLFIMIARLTEQKGADILLDALPILLGAEVNYAVIGDSNRNFAERFRGLARQHPNLDYFDGFDESRSHRLYAAADFLWIPSRFEPCGLNQMIAARYGTLPIVHRVGGLYDTVDAIGASDTCIQGIVLDRVDEAALIRAQKAALTLYCDTSRFHDVVVHNMRCDLSFAASARAYLALFEEM